MGVAPEAMFGTIVGEHRLKLQFSFYLANFLFPDEPPSLSRGFS
jgi:hypothetical protein